MSGQEDKNITEFDIPGFEPFKQLISQKPQAVELPEFQAAWLETPPKNLIDEEILRQAPGIQATKGKGIFRIAGAVAAVLVAALIGGWFYQNRFSNQPIVPVALEKGKTFKAVVAVVTGQVHFHKGQVVKKLEVGTPIIPGGKIVTGSKSHVEIVLGDGSFVQIKSDSVLAIRGLARNENGAHGHVFLEKGSIFSLINKAEKKSLKRFFVQTPTAIAGVRGTSFQVESLPGSSNIVLLEGRLDVRNCRSKNFEKLAAGEIITYTLSSPDGKRRQMTEPGKAALQKKADEIQTNIPAIIAPGVVDMMNQKETYSSEKEMQKALKKDIEVVTLKNGTVYRGVVLVQSGNKVIIQTMEGRKEVNTGNISSIEFD